MYLIETENELKELKSLLWKWEKTIDVESIEVNEYPIIKTLVRRFGRLEEVISKESFHQVLSREELEYFEGMDMIVQWVGYREFVLHKQLTPTLSHVIGLEWDFEVIKELAHFVSVFYEVIELEDCYCVEAKAPLKRLGEGDYTSLTKDFSRVWVDEINTNKIH